MNILLWLFGLAMYFVNHIQGASKYDPKYVNILASFHPFNNKKEKVKC